MTRINLGRAEVGGDVQGRQEVPHGSEGECAGPVPQGVRNIHSRLLQISGTGTVPITTVADPGSIPDPNFSTPDPGSIRFRIHIKEFKYF